MDNASDYGSELLGSTLGWLTLCFFCVSVSPQQTAGKIAFQIKNQITLLSHHHSTSALVSEILMSVLQTVQKNNRQFTYGQTVQKNNKQFTYGQVQKNCTGAFTVLQTVQKQHNLHMDRQCKKTTNNLHMDRQCKKQTKNPNKNTSNLHMDSTYLQTVQKTMCKIHNTYTQYA